MLTSVHNYSIYFVSFLHYTVIYVATFTYNIFYTPKSHSAVWCLKISWSWTSSFISPIFNARFLTQSLNTVNHHLWDLPLLLYPSISFTYTIFTTLLSIIITLKFWMKAQVIKNGIIITNCNQSQEGYNFATCEKASVYYKVSRARL